MLSHTPNPRRYLPRAIRTYGLLAALIVIFAQLTAWSQQPAPTGIKNFPAGPHNTPKQVIAGTAKLVQAYDPSSKLRLAISIKAPKMAEEEKLLKELQDRNSPNFKKYLTPEQWNARFAPAAEDEQAVVDWAASRGLTVLQRYPNRLMVNVEGTVDAIQRAFNIRINKYEVNGTVEFSNDTDPQIPSNLQSVIEYVDGLNSILRMRPANSSLKGVRGPDYSPGPFIQKGLGVRTDPTKAVKPAKAVSTKPADKGQVGAQLTNDYLDPSDIFSSNLYDYNALMAQGHCCNPLGNSGGSPVETTIGLATDGDFANSDVLAFASQYSLQFQGYRIYVGGTPYCCDDETTLDFEWSSTTSNSFNSPDQSSTIRVYEAANGFGDFGSIFNQMVTDNDVRVVNISYGLNESYLNGYGLVSSWHSIFNQMLGQGMTIMAAAGDNGATAGCGDSISLLYPGSDPDVVSVGGTQVELYSDGSFYSEVAWTGGTYSGACSANNGGTGGGCSALFAAPGYQSSPACGSGSRSVPDVALNAATGQNYYFNGSLQGVGGTSISSPMMSGFVAQANAYLLAIGLGGAPVGEVNYKLYYLGAHSGNSYEAHYPFYDVTSGCNSNDITAYYGFGSYCAGTGYDLTTGWGSFNALQLSWAINTYDLGDFQAPTITFSGPAHTQGAVNWYNTDQTVSWTVADNAGVYPATGVAGFSQAWDASISDPTGEATPGSGNAFYSGPQFPNATSGYLKLSWAGQGCHYATVDAWDNSGFSSGNQYYYYLCYDTIAPTVTAANSPAANSNGYNNSTVKVSLSATDSGSAASGIKTTYYGVNTPCNPSNLGACSVYTGPVSVTGAGYNYVAYFTVDVAGNNSGTSYDTVYIDEVAPVSSVALAGTYLTNAYDTAVKVTLGATDNYSGVASTHYSVDGGAFATYSAPFNVTALGSHTVKYYSVDYAGNTEATKSVSFTITSLTTTTLTVTPDHVLTGQPVTLSAHVVANLGGTPAGTVTFKDGTTTVGTGTLSGGTATITSTTLPLGNTTLTASYAGAGNYRASTSAAVSEDVRTPSTTTLTSSLNPAIFGQAVTFTAKVAIVQGHTPSGTITFLDGTTTLGTITMSGGQATLTTSALSGGGHSITASYSGSTIYHNGVSAALTETIKKDTTTISLTATPNPAISGQTVTLKATVGSAHSGTPSGTVTFKNGTTTIGTGTLVSGVATFSTTTLPVGTDSLTALYAGSTNLNASTSAAVSEAVHQKTTTTVASSLNPSGYDKSVTFTATVTPSVSGTPTGSVNFLDGATLLGTSALSGGKATFATQKLTAGSHSITAAYSGSTTYGASTSSALTQTVTKAVTAITLTSSVNPSTYGQTITFTATAKTSGQGNPDGTVSFKYGTNTFGSATLVNGVATYSIASFSVGTHAVEAVYAGDGNYNASTSSALNEVTTAASTKTTLTSSLNPATHGSAVTFSAKITAATGPVPSGTAVFKDGSTTLGTGTVNGSGIANFSTSALAVGTHSITAVYGGNTNDQASTSAVLSQVIK